MSPGASSAPVRVKRRSWPPFYLNNGRRRPGLSRCRPGAERTPALSSASVDAHTTLIEVDPLDIDTWRMAYEIPRRV